MTRRGLLASLCALPVIQRLCRKPSEREFYRGLKTVTCRPLSLTYSEPEPGILISDSLTPEQAEKFAQFALEAIKDKDFIENFSPERPVNLNSAFAKLLRESS